MTSRFSSRDSLHVLQRLDEDRLRLRPSSLGAWIGYSFILVGSLAILSKISNGSVWLFGLFFVLIGCLTRFGPPTTVWDRKTGLLRIRRFHLRHEYPLSRIKAVRVIRGSWVIPQMRPHRLSYQSYFLVLCLDDAAEERLYLLENGTAQLQDEYGRTIAQFLGVPYFDERQTAAERHSQSILQSQDRHRVSPGKETQAKQARWALKRDLRKEKRAKNAQ